MHWKLLWQMRRQMCRQMPRLLRDVLPEAFSEAVPGGHLRAARDRLAHAEVDLADPDAPRRLLRMATDRFGPVDALVANHARSSSYPLAGVTAAELDAAGR